MLHTLRCWLNKTGLEGERAAAFYLHGHYKDKQKNVVLRDACFQIDEEVVQIDHLVINRTASSYL
jgi:hypothetical protein